MVEYGKKISEYSVGDTVYVHCSISPFVDKDFKWRKVKVVEILNSGSDLIFDEANAAGVVQCSNGKIFYIALETTVLTEQQYKDIQLEKKFMTW